MSPPGRSLLPLALCTALLPPLVSAESAPALPLDSGRVLLLFPATRLYPPYTADIQRTAFSVRQLNFTRSELLDSSNDRVAVKMGGTFGLVRSHPSGQAERGWQIDLDVGMNSEFDNERNQDNVGWDGKYGLLFTAPLAHNLALRSGLQHTSSHVGDEYAERTGRLRIGYTREELAAGLSWWPRPALRLYGEAGWGYLLNNTDEQEPGRLQAGAEWERPHSLWEGRLGWYLAFDASAMEERNWRVDTALQAGLMLNSDGRIWRAGVEFYEGRPLVAEFFQANERYAAFGFWLDL